MPVVLGPLGATLSATSNAVDCASASFVADVLSAAKFSLSTAHEAILPMLITAASREIVRYCGRPFALQTFTEIVQPEGGRQDRGEPAAVKLNYFPVQSVSRCASGRATILTVSNTDTATNQEAFAQFATTGDVEYFDLAYTGLTLTRTASGTQSTNTVSWTTTSPYTTIQSVATAINGLGGGWSATVQANVGSNSQANLLPAAYLVGAREPKNAFSPGCALDAFTQPLSGYDVDRATGILRCYWNSTWGSGFGMGGFGLGDPYGASWDGQGGWGGGVLNWPQIQLTYSAGFAVVPEDVQLVCAELVKMALERIGTNTTLASESDDGYSYSVRQLIYALPDWALQVLTMRKDWKV